MSNFKHPCKNPKPSATASPTCGRRHQQGVRLPCADGRRAAMHRVAGVSASLESLNNKVLTRYGRHTTLWLWMSLWLSLSLSLSILGSSKG